MNTYSMIIKASDHWIIHPVIQRYNTLTGREELVVGAELFNSPIAVFSRKSAENIAHHLHPILEVFQSTGSDYLWDISARNNTRIPINIGQGINSPHILAIHQMLESDNSLISTNLCEYPLDVESSLVIGQCFDDTTDMTSTYSNAILFTNGKNSSLKEDMPLMKFEGMFQL